MSDAEFLLKLGEHLSFSDSIKMLELVLWLIGTGFQFR